MTSKQTWKKAEKDIAEYLNWNRVSNKGLGFQVEDICDNYFCGEVKVRANLPEIITMALKQAESVAGEKIPVGFIKPKGQSIEKTVVTLSLPDFKYMLRKIDWFS